MFLKSSPTSQIESYIDLPLTLMTLDDWVLIEIVGQDSEKYLQNQITADIKQIDEYKHLLTANCNPKGRVFGTLRLFRYKNDFAFITRSSIKDIQLAELKKYAIFSKVSFKIDSDSVLLGIAGFHARSLLLSNLFNELPTEEKQIISNGNTTTILWFKHPAERFLLITNAIEAEQINKKLYGKVQFNNSKQWLALDIEAGIPIIDSINSGLFIPQEINLQALGGISFNKGCYLGQEVIAKIKLRNINKRAMYYLAGFTNLIPKIGESIEMKVNNNWRRTGIVLTTVKLKKNYLLLQVVLSNSMNQNTIFRICGDIETLHIQPMPYTL